MGRRRTKIMNDEEKYDITKELSKIKVDDNLGEIWTYPAMHIFHGKLPNNVVNDLIEYCTITNNDNQSNKLVANIKGTQSTLDINDPLMKEYIDTMMRSACTFIDNCRMDYGGNGSSMRVEIEEIWDVKMTPGDYNPMHIHGTESSEGLSSITYIKVPESFREAAERGRSDPKYAYYPKHDGWLELLWGLTSDAMTSNQFSCANNAFVLPQVGDFYIFPKSLNHLVYPYRENEDRWSIQINYNCWSDGEEEAYDRMKEIL